MYDTNEVLERFSNYDLKKSSLHKIKEDFNLKPIEEMNGKMKILKWPDPEIEKLANILHMRKVDNRRIHSIQMIMGIEKESNPDINYSEKKHESGINDSENDFIDLEYEEERDLEIETKLQVFKDSLADKFNLMLQEIKNESFEMGKVIGSLSAELGYVKSDKDRLIIETEKEVARVQEQSINDLYAIQKEINKKDLELKEVYDKLEREREEKNSLKTSLEKEKSKSFWQKLRGK